MTFYTPRPNDFGSMAAFDVRGLNRLREGVTAPGDAEAKNREVAKQFESLFLQLMLKRMREATPRDGLFESDQTRMVQSLADEQLATQLAEPGIGLAQALLDQIHAQQGGDAGQDKGASMQHAPELAASRVPGLRSRIAGDSAGEAVAAVSDAMLSRQTASSGRRNQTVAAASDAPNHVQSFVERMGKAALRAASQIGMPAPVILAQAALESGWGRHEIRHPDGSNSHNLFGIKAGGSWRGKVVDVVTTEYEAGVPRKLVQSFRAYDSYQDAFEDYTRWLADNPRYHSVLDARSGREAAHRLQSAGYATDPNYAQKLIDVMANFSRGTGAVQQAKYMVSAR